MLIPNTPINFVIGGILNGDSPVSTTPKSILVSAGVYPNYSSKRPLRSTSSFYMKLTNGAIILGGKINFLLQQICKKMTVTTYSI